MSLLSNPQAHPERIRSVVALHRAYEDPVSSEDAHRWLAPPVERASKRAATGSIKEAVGLGLLTSTERGNTLANVSCPTEPAAFADALHSVLIDLNEDDANHALLRTYAWIVFKCDQERGTTWLRQLSRTRLAEQIGDALSARDAPYVRNPTQLTPWTRWMSFLGLGWEGGSSSFMPYFLPDPTKRMEREFQKIGQQMGFEKELPADDVFSSLASRMPYIDGGHIFEEISQMCGQRTDTKDVSALTSASLRQLHDGGQITLYAPEGDAPDVWRLERNRFDALKNVLTITIHRESTDE